MKDNNQQNSTINWYPGHMVKTKRKIIENIGLIDVVYELDRKSTRLNSSHA